jgi:subtilisin family serine protease
MKSLLSILTCFLLSMLFTFDTYGQKINADLALDFTISDKVEVLIQFRNGLDASVYENARLTKEEKGKLVYTALSEQATITQEAVQSLLSQKDITYKSYVLANVIQCTIDKLTAEKIAAYNEVIAITTNPSVMIQEPEVNPLPLDLRGGEPEWGVEQIQADSVWSLGYRGELAVVAGEDTGYDWDNLLIKEKYRGWISSGTDSVDHNYNWHDAITEISPLHGDTLITDTTNPCGLASTIPCDDHGHGSHTMGTMVGEDEENAIGVAPGAQWIGCRNMERGYGSPATYLNCFEWFLAPTDTAGMNPDPVLAPDVINNSWRCPELEGCNEDNWNILETAVNNLKAAGIIVVASAGNDGPDCNTIDAPPAMFENAFVVGASNNADLIANFSSRGTVTADSSFLLKPDVVAPGVGVRSIRLNDNFGTWNGTSMAGPHVAGTVALIISANPSLRGQVSVIEEILIQSALTINSNQDCNDVQGASVPNAVYGYGRINALKAVELALGISDTEENSLVSEIKVFPNPGRDELIIQLENASSIKSLSLSDLSGRIIYTQTKQVSYQNVIPVSNLSNGVYIINMQSGEEILTRKWVKQ